MGNYTGKPLHEMTDDELFEAAVERTIAYEFKPNVKISIGDFEITEHQVVFPNRDRYHSYREVRYEFLKRNGYTDMSMDDPPEFDDFFSKVDERVKEYLTDLITKALNQALHSKPSPTIGR